MLTTRGKIIVPSNCGLASHRIRKTCPSNSPNRPAANWIARLGRWLSVDILDLESLSCLRDTHCSHRRHHRAMQCPLSSNFRNNELCAHLKRWKREEMNIDFWVCSKEICQIYLGYILMAERACKSSQKWVRSSSIRLFMPKKINRANITVYRITSEIRYSQCDSVCLIAGGTRIQLLCRVGF